MIPLFVPEPMREGNLGRHREVVEPDGSTIRFSTVSEVRDEEARRQETVLRYERLRGGTSIVVDRPWTVHWCSQASFRALAAGAGLATTMVFDAAGGVADGAETDCAFWLQAAP